MRSSTLSTNPSEFAILIKQYFGSLRNQRDLSNNTILAYRDTFRLLLHFLAKNECTTIDKLSLDSLTADLVLSFLEHLAKNRGNSVRTRNARLAAIHAFARFAIGQKSPDFLAAGQRILAIQGRRAVKKVLGFMNREEIEAILSAVDSSSPAGRRDYLLFTLLYNTGGRISEILQLKPMDIQNRIVRLHGKGRKERDVPIWLNTKRAIARWCKAHQIGPSQYLFSNRNGVCISRRGAALRLTLALRTAAKSCQSLQGRKITLHTFRHSTAMHLLQAGVALPIISLWLGHESAETTQCYIEADLKMKEQCLNSLEKLPNTKWQPKQNSHLLAFLESL